MKKEGLWLKVNQDLVAKSLGELAYEQILRPTLLHKEGLNGSGLYRVDLKSGVSYRFHAWQGVWEYLRVRADSIERIEGDKTEQVKNAGQFFVDARIDLEMTEIVLGNFLEEMHSTLFSDMRILEKNQGLRASELATWDGHRVQLALNGHPKILLNKGRMGWGAQDLLTYAPENEKPFQLAWIAVRRSRIRLSLRAGVELESLYRESLSEEEISSLSSKLKDEGYAVSSYFIAPVHPWQWDRIVQIQFAGEIAMGNIVYLGLAGDLYQPQISLRTLSNVTHPEKSDIKLPLSILNTSAVRGIPSRYIDGAPAVSEAVSRLCATDTFLKASGTDVFEEKAGFSYVQPTFAQVQGAPYRYHELLGAVWRESVHGKTRDPGETGVVTAALFYQDEFGRSLIGAYIEKSGLNPAEWLKRYFEAVVIPLYHLQLKYGLGLVAHGQNIVLKLRDFMPVGMWLKDFHGDLRLSAEESELQKKFLSSVASHLDRLPPHYLIHDLVTGHFLTVLRFVSVVLEESDGFSESEFYRILSECVHSYIEKHALAHVNERTDILSEKFHRVLLNKVRFRIGYADSAERPLPMLGEDLKNPLYRGGLPC